MFLMHFIRFQRNLTKITFFNEFQRNLTKINIFNIFNKIYDFLEISTTKTDLVKMVEKYNFKNIPSDRKGPGKFTRSATPGDWKKNLSKQEQNIMMPIMLETLKERGYKV